MNDDAPPLYEIRHLEHRYNGRPVLRIDWLAIETGTVTAAVGPNGSGKSTLLTLLALLESPSVGEIRYRGRPARPFDPFARFRVTILTQTPYLMKRSVFDNIAYGLKVRHDRTNVAERVAEALSWVGLSNRSFSGRKWYELSGGEAQRVALAARLILKPEVLLLDEPTASVDAASAQRIKEAALRARETWGTTLVIASHDRGWVNEICDTAIHLFGGRPVGGGGENIIFGPWSEGPDGAWGRSMGAEGGEEGRLLVPRPPAPDAVALLGADDLRILETADPAGEGPAIGAKVTRMVLEKRNDRIAVTAMSDSHPFTVSVARDRAEALSLYPGSRIRLTYTPEAVRWHQEE